MPAFQNDISNSQYFAHDCDEKRDSCTGDSGGPLQIMNNDQAPAKVAGIVSISISHQHNIIVICQELLLESHHISNGLNLLFGQMVLLYELKIGDIDFLQYFYSFFNKTRFDLNKWK